MEHRDVHSAEADSDSIQKFSQFREYLTLSSDGRLDLEQLLNSDYGAQFTRRLSIRFAYEQDAMGRAALDYYRSIGLKKEMFDEGDYYSRWVMFTPLSVLKPENAGHKFPLVISQHGGGSSIETDEFSTGFPELAAREQFFVAILQNTNWDNVSRTLDRILERFPVDADRVYMSGLSQGGSQTNTCLHRMPERLAAVALNSCDFYRSSDNFDVPFTPEEKQRVKAAGVPVIYTVGVNDASYYVPLNQWRPRKDWDGKLGDPETYHPAACDNEHDPTWIHDPTRGFRDAARLKMAKEPHWWMCHPSCPLPGEDMARWAIDRVNQRLELLGCAPRDIERCLQYANVPRDEFHHLLGIYGDREYIRYYYGWKHYCLDIDNPKGINMFRMVVVENFPHWQSVMMAELCWDFFRQFHR